MDILNIKIDLLGIGNNLLYILYYINIASKLNINYNIDSNYFKLLFNYKSINEIMNMILLKQKKYKIYKKK